jgi:preprotein translocase subunit SecF
MSRFGRLGHSLYEGTVSVDFVGRRYLWYAFSGVLLAVSLFGLFVVKLNMGIEFEGGVEYRVSIQNPSQGQVDEVRRSVQDTGFGAASAPIVNTSGEDAIRVQTKPLSSDDARVVSRAILDVTGVATDDLSASVIGPSWGAEVGKKAIRGLVVFLALVLVLIWVYFREWKMSVAAMFALFHDLVITVGIYALSGFEVTPTTVTGVLTILAFSLYDTIVVFDKVRENVGQLRRSHQTYAEAANLAVNQTLVRSINTSIVALLPLGALLYAGVVMLGSGALKDLALSLFVGTAVGIYSSVFIATPLLVQLKHLEPGVRSGDARAMRHRSRRPVDPYADVPVYTEDMPVLDAPDEGPPDSEGGSVPGERGGAPVSSGGNRPGPAGAPGRYSAGERDTSRRAAPLSDNTSARRPQPSRKPRSQRGKK